MKKQIIWLMAILVVPGVLITTSQAHAGAGVSISLPGFGLSVGPGGFGLNVGLPWVVVPAPAPAPVVAPTYAYPDDTYEPVAEAVPEFVQPPELGFYVAVGVPYDLFFYNNSYYVYRGNIWYSSPYYNGPWTNVYYNNVPYVFNRFPFERIRHYRDTYYGRYQRHGAWDRYNHFRPARQHATTGRDRHVFSGPPNQTTTRYSTDYRTQANPGHGSSNYVANRPTRQTYDNNHAYSRLNGTNQATRGRTVYYRPNATSQHYGSGAGQRSHIGSAPSSGTRPAQIRPERNGYNAGRQTAAGRTGYNQVPNSYPRTNEHGFNRTTHDHFGAGR